MIIQGKEESAIAAYWVTDGIDSCRVGFLPKHCVRHWALYEGRLAQVTEMYKDNTSPHKRKQDYKNMGCCMAALISPCLNIPMERTRPVSHLPDEQNNPPNEGNNKRRRCMQKTTSEVHEKESHEKTTTEEAQPIEKM